MRDNSGYGGEAGRMAVKPCPFRPEGHAEGVWPSASEACRTDIVRNASQSSSFTGIARPGDSPRRYRAEPRKDKAFPLLAAVRYFSSSFSFSRVPSGRCPVLRKNLSRHS